MKNKILILFFTLVPIALIIKCSIEKKEAKLLLNSVDTHGILIQIKKSGVHNPGSGKIRYNVNDQEYEFWSSGGYEFLEPGDTVLIEYSKKDNSVARVTNKYYALKSK